jgi:hypothetical protein
VVAVGALAGCLAVWRGRGGVWVARLGGLLVSGWHAALPRLSGAGLLWALAGGAGGGRFGLDGGRGAVEGVCL